MGRLIKPDGTVVAVRPANGKRFSLQELQGLVGGYIKLARTLSGKIMFINEDGKRLNLQPNLKATAIAGLQGDTIVGNAIVCDKGETN